MKQHSRSSCSSYCGRASGFTPASGATLVARGTAVAAGATVFAPEVLVALGATALASGTVVALGSMALASRSAVASGATALASRSAVALGSTVFAPEVVVALGATAVARGAFVAFGVIRGALGTIRAALGDERAAARCATETPVSNPSNNPAKIIFFILALLAKFELLACTNVAKNEGKANTRVIHPLRPAVGNFFALGKICCGRDSWLE
jgi:hypothetical protein